MDFVWVCRRGDNEELRYSIRSVLASFPEAKIWVVGGKPGWYSGNFIESNVANNKYKQVEENLIQISSSEEISESFVLMNDDFFIVKKISSIETFHRGDLGKAAIALKKLNSSNLYSQRLINMRNMIRRDFKIENPLNYELHVPMPMEKGKLAEILGKKYPMWRSVYGNKYNLGGIEIQDVKIHTNPIYSTNIHDHMVSELPFMSCDDASFKLLVGYLEELFPEPSKHELDK